LTSVAVQEKLLDKLAQLERCCVDCADMKEKASVLCSSV